MLENRITSAAISEKFALTDYTDFYIVSINDDAKKDYSGGLTLRIGFTSDKEKPITLKVGDQPEQQFSYEDLLGSSENIEKSVYKLEYFFKVTKTPITIESLNIAFDIRVKAHIPLVDYFIEFLKSGNLHGTAYKIGEDDDDTLLAHNIVGLIRGHLINESKKLTDTPQTPPPQTPPSPGGG